MEVLVIPQTDWLSWESRSVWITCTRQRFLCWSLKSCVEWPVFQTHCWLRAVVLSSVKWSVSGRQRANGSVLCDVMSASELLILLYRAVELCKVVLTAPTALALNLLGPFSLSHSLSLFLAHSFLSGCVKEGHCVRHTPTLRPPITNPGPLLLLLPTATRFRSDAESTSCWLSSVVLLG